MLPPIFYKVKLIFVGDGALDVPKASGFLLLQTKTAHLVDNSLGMRYNNLVNKIKWQNAAQKRRQYYGIRIAIIQRKRHYPKGT